MKYIFYFIAVAILISVGWFGRAILDDSLISRETAAELTAAAVETAIKDKEKRDAQQPKIAAAITTVRSAAKIVPSTACPPGTGALSDDVAASMRDAFKPIGD
jgi:hypothetical protein